MIGADLLVAAFKAQGIPFVATVSGNGLNPFYVACRRAELPIVDFRNEQAASYAADAYARLTGKMGLCAVSSGIAHVNAFSGLLNAHYDGAPVMLFTGASDHSRADQGRFQDLDQAALAAPLCKYSRTVDLAQRIPFYVREACVQAVSGRPGPVHLTVPLDVLGAEVELPTHGDRTAPARVNPRAGADPAAVGEVLDLLAHSRRPLLIAGGGVFYAQAGEELHTLAAGLGIPVQVPIWDRADIPRPTPYYAGVIGAASGGPSLLADADLILLVGADVDYRLGYLEPPAVSPRAKIVRVDADPTRLRRCIEPDLAIQADPRSALAALATGAAKRGLPPFEEWRAEACRRAAEYRGHWLATPPSAGPMSGWHVVDALRPLVDGNDELLFLVDGGNIGQWVHQAMGDRYPANWLTCGASGVVGWGLPGAIGARLAYPDRPIILLSGDGSFGFTTAELETAVRHDTSFVAIVADDRCWGIVASGQARQYGPEGVLGSTLGPVRYDTVAEGFGAFGRRAETPAELVWP